MNNLFEDTELLKIYDELLPLSEHYKSILNIHINTLFSCKEIIDLGCGTGILTLEYLKAGKKVTGVDVSDTSIEILKLKAKEYQKNLLTITADTTNLDMIDNNTYDGASSMIAAHLIPDFNSHISEAFRILKPDGLFVITARTRKGNQSLLVDILKESLIKLGVFDTFENEFQKLSNDLLMTASGRSPSLKSEEEVINILQDAGFKNIHIVPNMTKGVMYTVIAQKQ